MLSIYLGGYYNYSEKGIHFWGLREARIELRYVLLPIYSEINNFTLLRHISSA
jgi:hypothetical protein